MFCFCKGCRPCPRLDISSVCVAIVFVPCGFVMFSTLFLFGPRCRFLIGTV